jgi:hypothetical protein
VKEKKVSSKETPVLKSNVLLVLLNNRLLCSGILIHIINPYSCPCVTSKLNLCLKLFHFYLLKRRACCTPCRSIPIVSSRWSPRCAVLWSHSNIFKTQIQGLYFEQTLTSLQTDKEVWVPEVKLFCCFSNHFTSKTVTSREKYVC